MIKQVADCFKLFNFLLSKKNFFACKQHTKQERINIFGTQKNKLSFSKGNHNSIACVKIKIHYFISHLCLYASPGSRYPYWAVRRNPSICGTMFNCFIITRSQWCLSIIIVIRIFLWHQVAFILLFTSTIHSPYNHFCVLDTTLGVLNTWYRLHVMNLYNFCTEPD